jgi:hypothetical protein
MLTRNKKNNKLYEIIGDVVNTTNELDGQIMVLYTDGKSMYVREKEEFNNKFENVGNEN